MLYVHIHVGHRLKGRDVVFAGVATHIVPRSQVTITEIKMSVATVTLGSMCSTSVFLLLYMYMLF